MAARTDSVGTTSTGGQPSTDQRLRDTGGQLQTLKSATIMIVDDEPTMIEVLQAFLEQAGYEHFVTTTEPGPALSLLPKKRPDVVLLDVMMPGITGLEILTWIRSNEALKHTPVIILTSSTDPETMLKALELGATDFLGKPVDPSELVLRLRNTLAAKAYRDRLENYDGVTGLPNRRLFVTQLRRTLRRGKKTSTGVLFHIDLDRFKQINDALGHRTGDAVLVEVADRLEECRSDRDLLPSSSDGRQDERCLSRIAGDEFMLFLPGVPRLEEATMVARRILRTLGKPFHLDGKELSVSASVGIAVYPSDGEDADSLLKNAGAALSHAKQRGRNTYQYFSKELNARALERLSLEGQLRNAIDRRELALYFQTKLSVETRRVTGAEALLRWQHPELGMVTPGRFIPIAEESGLIVPFDEWVMYAACEVSKRSQSLGCGPIPVSVNVSSQHFRNPDRLVLTVRNALETSGLDGKHLCLELTESMIMEDPSENVKTLQEIKKMGVKLSIDDFGTGYSSLNYLRRFPLDELKIDRSFLRDVPDDADGVAIVSAIVAMGHSLGLTVVAEGVEDEKQLSFLEIQRCDEYQGFLASKPMPAGELLALAASDHQTAK